MNRQTIFSPCRQWRYTLWRVWDESKPYCMFVALNPSTADEVLNDPTVTRCINFAKSWGFGALCMTNIFAYRATDPRVMKAQADPIGVDNDKWLKEISHGAGLVVAAWGTHGAFLDRGRQVCELINNLECLDITKGGFPKHPLYVRADIQRQVYRMDGL
jgi:hypothetical protein